MVELKKKPPPLVVTMEDGTKRSILVDPTALGGDLAEVIVEGTTEDHNKRYHYMTTHPPCRPLAAAAAHTTSALFFVLSAQGAGTVRFRPLLRRQRLRRSREGPRGSALLVSAVAQHVGQLLDRQARSPAMTLTAQLVCTVANMRPTAHAHARPHTRTHAKM